MGQIRLILYDYMVKCMKELAKAEPDIDSLLPWNFSHSNAPWNYGALTIF
jgi:hypothetical protein